MPPTNHAVVSWVFSRLRPNTTPDERTDQTPQESRYRGHSSLFRTVRQSGTLHSPFFCNTVLEAQAIEPEEQRRRQPVKSIAFYLLFYFYPIAKTIFAIIRRFFAFVSILMLIAAFYKGFSIGHLLAAAICFIGSICGLILQEKYTTLLLKLQPNGTDYTFYC